MDFVPQEHQKLAIPWLENRNEAALFMGMGLGKSACTLQAYRNLLSAGASKGLLIVAPLRVSVLTWPHEVQKWNQFRCMKTFSLRTEEGVQAWHDKKGSIFTINYEMLPAFCRKFLDRKTGKDLPVDSICFDELSCAKSNSSVRIAAIRAHRLKFHRHWGLTGTPTPNSYVDLFAQIRLLDGGKRFGQTLCDFKSNYLVPDNPKSEHPKYLVNPHLKGLVEKRIHDLALVLKSEDWLKIPPVEVIDYPVPMPKAAKKPYKEIEKELLTLLECGTEIVAVNAGVLVGKLLQITSGAVYDQDRNVGLVHDAKIQALKKIQKLHPGEPLLVATQFIHERERVLKAFPEAEVFQENTLDRWNKGKIPMLVAHPKSMGHGLNMQDGGRIVVWFTLNWSQELYDQLNARLARFGQQHRTLIYRLLMPMTADDAVAEALRNKADSQTSFMNTLKNIQELKRAA